MPIIKENDLKKALKEKNFHNVYFLYGAEKFLVKYYTNELVDKILDGSNNEFNYQKFKNDNIKINNIIDSVEVLPIMSNIKCVLVEDINIEDLDLADLKKLYGLIEDLPKTCILIISHKALEFDKKKSTKWKKFISTIDSYGAVIELNKMGTMALEKQLVSWAKRRNTILSSLNANKIISFCGSDLTMLRNELEKLCAYVGYNEIKEEDINDIITKNLETTVFILSNSLLSCNYDMVFKQLDILFYQKEDPIAILAVLSSAYIDMYRVKIATQEGKSLSELSKYFDYKNKEFRLKNAQEDSKKLSLSILRKCIFEILKVDFLLKSSSLEKRYLLEELIAKLMVICE